MRFCFGIDWFKWHRNDTQKLYTQKTQPVSRTLTDSKTICPRKISNIWCFSKCYPNFHDLAIIEIARKKTNIENLPCKISLDLNRCYIKAVCFSSRISDARPYPPTTSGCSGNPMPSGWKPPRQEMNPKALGEEAYVELCWRDFFVGAKVDSFGKERKYFNRSFNKNMKQDSFQDLYH